MPHSIELYGIARSRAGVAQTSVGGSSLGDVLAELAQTFPALAEACIDGRTLRPGFAASLNGDCLLFDPETPLIDDQTLLLFSLDAGG